MGAIKETHKGTLKGTLRVKGLISECWYSKAMSFAAGQTELKGGHLTEILRNPY